MTTNIDDLEKRITSQKSSGREDTQGIPKEGFADASGEYPNREYFFGTSINKSAKGEKVNELFSGGGDYGVETLLADQKPSQYPYNQVQETTSGHSIEIDDTPGGERILLKHKTGAGVELRADGSVLFSSVNTKVEVTGGDHTVIVEGEGNLIYKGNLNVHVTGDYNLTVDGNINVDVAGNKDEKIHRSHTKVIDEHQNYTIKGDAYRQILGTNTDVILSDNFLRVKGNQINDVEKKVQLNSGDTLLTTAKTSWSATSSTVNVTGHTLNATSTLGTIGGDMVDHFGKTYGGPAEGKGEGLTTFYGTLVGKASCAITADVAQEAAHSIQAKWASVASYADSAGLANSQTYTENTTGTTPSKPTKPAAPDYSGIYYYTPGDATNVMPDSKTIPSKINESTVGIRKVFVDLEPDNPDSLYAEILKTDDYDEIFRYEPNIHEIRCRMRVEANRNNSKFTGTLVSEGRLSDTYGNIMPKEIGRTVNKKPAVRFGLKPLGNNPLDKKSKRFTP